jgi:hypothetical protein
VLPTTRAYKVTDIYVLGLRGKGITGVVHIFLYDNSRLVKEGKRDGPNYRYLRHRALPIARIKFGGHTKIANW